MRRMDHVLQEARRLKPVERRRLMEKLAQGSLEPSVPKRAIAGQIEGDWLHADVEIPGSVPPYPPAAAVLPLPGSSLSNEFFALDLVPIEGTWRPLSDAGRYTYAHSDGLLRGEKWRFMTRPESAGTQPAVYEASYADSLTTAAELKQRYGKDVARRARDDQPTVQLKLRRLR